MLKNHLEYKPKKIFLNYHNLSAVFRKVEAVLFVIICLVLIISSKINNHFTNSLSMSVVEISMPIAKVVSLPFNMIAEAAIDFQELVGVKNKNILLIKENEQLKSLYVKSLNVYQENKQLKEVLQYVKPRSTKFVVTRLIFQPYQTYSNNVFIDSGSSSNIKDGDVVTGNKALIGRVETVSDDKSRVLLATDINSRIPVIVSGAGTKGILAGNNSNVMDILYLEKNHHIKIGDMVFTSGNGDALPPGLLIGSVIKVGKGYAEVKMVENVKNLDMVSVINY